LQLLRATKGLAAAAGGFLYFHKRHGGDMSPASLKRGATFLYYGAKQKLRDVRDQRRKEHADRATAYTPAEAPSASTAAPATH
jgi:hypothetical protein